MIRKSSDLFNWVLLILSAFAVNGIGATPCAATHIDSGYGVPGPYRAVVDTASNVLTSNKNLYIFRPENVKEKVPCILFCPKYGSEDPIEYAGFIHYLVSKGFIVVYPTYKAQAFTRKSIEIGMRSDDLFKATAQAAITYIDTTRIGFIGHSYGAGILPALVKRIVENTRWGTKGVFMYLLSPWYFPGISKRELENFPQNVKVVIEVFEDDNINDPRIGSYLFQLLHKPPENKIFYAVYSDRRNGCRLKSDFFLPLSEEAYGGEDNALDTLALYRISDALTKAVFNNDTEAAAFVFGKGIPQKMFMGKWHDGTPVKEMIATKDPKPFLSKRPYINSWISARNPFTDVSRFREAKKIYFDFVKKKLRSAARFLADNKKKDKISSSEDDVFENPIDSGYGADGSYTVQMDTVANPANKPDCVRFFHPAETRSRCPVVILLHGYSGPDYRYFEPFISHIVSRGYAVLYPPYPILPLVSNEKRILEKITIMKTGIQEGIRAWKDKMDTTRIAVMGQSFGGGMTPAIAYTMLNEKKWGNNGAFLYITAPWYCCQITQQQLRSFPPNLKLLMIVFDDDLINDHQMAVDIFNTINIPPQEKDFVTFYTDSFSQVTMNANHFVPYGINYIYGELNLMDYFGIYKLFDAMADYVFNKNMEAKKTALGDGAKEQTYMGQWNETRLVKPLTVTDTPKALHTQYQYFHAWDNPLNPRRDANNIRNDSTVIKSKVIDNIKQKKEKRKEEEKAEEK